MGLLGLCGRDGKQATCPASDPSGGLGDPVRERRGWQLVADAKHTWEVEPVGLLTGWV